MEGLRPTSGPGSLALFSPEMQGCEGKGSVVGSARLARLWTHRWSEAGWASEVIKHLYRGEKCVPEKGGGSCQQLEVTKRYFGPRFAVPKPDQAPESPGAIVPNTTPGTSPKATHQNLCRRARHLHCH